LQKVAAVKILDRASSGEALTLLKKVFLAADTETVAGDVHIQREDRMLTAAAHSARALGRRSDPAGWQFLVKTAKTESSSLVLRELAIFGLAGVSSSAAWKTLGEMLGNDSPHLRRAAVMALSESLASLRKDQFTPLHVSILEEVANVAFSSDRELERQELVIDDGRQLARQLLVQHATSEIEEKIAKVLFESTDEDSAVRAAEILASRTDESSREVLRKCLMSRRRPAGVYRTIARNFAGTHDARIKTAASKVLSEGFVVRALTRAAAPSFQAASERFRAGAAIMHGVDPAISTESKVLLGLEKHSPSISKQSNMQAQATKLSSW
jgi:hypothetical protein